MSFIPELGPLNFNIRLLVTNKYYFLTLFIFSLVSHTLNTSPMNEEASKRLEALSQLRSQLIDETIFISFSVRLKSKQRKLVDIAF